MESIRWLLATAGVEFEEVFLTKREQYVKLLNDGALMFQQVPLVEIDGMQIVQSKAILNYIAGKYNLYGKDLKERALIDMYTEGTLDLMDLIMLSAIAPPENKQKQLSDIEQKAKERFMPVFEKWKRENGVDPMAFGRSWSRDGALMFQQVPLVEIDGMQIVQTKAIMNYITGKYNLYGKDLKQRALIDMYAEGTSDLMDLIIMSAIAPPEDKQKQLSDIEQKAKDRFLPVFEKGLANSHFLVGNQLSRADVHLLEATLMLQEIFPTILSTFPKIQFEEVFMTKKEHYDKLLNDGALMFQQVPLVEIDGMQIVQTKAILNYIAGKYNLYGKDLKERALIDMYAEGTIDLMDLIMGLTMAPPENKQKQLSDIEQKAKERFMPVFEKAFQERMKALPRISKFLQPGSARKPPPDEVYVKTVKEVLSHLFK
ncbi:Glutathione S-transferase [Anabarilius grahami]|uniref:glutathione transferase n=1 Tax=Anabarilius grahami TaxID=495550 RepID=A0A3N0YDX2_ANAGA|nr:Glutathione S-transferase [Anabarilius grahami]